MLQQSVAPAAAGDLHARLRNATKALHHELDHHPLLMPLVRGNPTRLQYGRALMALHGVYGVLEAAVCDPALAAGFNYPERRKTPALEADLRDLGQGFQPCRVSIPPPDGMGALIGMLYILEGSTLGAQAISRQLARHSAETLPMRHFTGYGDATLANWLAFWAFAERVCPPGASGDACGAAAMAFRAIRGHLDDVQKELEITLAVAALSPSAAPTLAQRPVR